MGEGLGTGSEPGSGAKGSALEVGCQSRGVARWIVFSLLRLRCFVISCPGLDMFVLNYCPWIYRSCHTRVLMSSMMYNLDLSPNPTDNSRTAYLNKVIPSSSST
jgi:hypothetical protein